MQIKFLPASNFIFQLPLSSPLTSDLCPLAAPSEFCQDAYMKQFFLGYLLSALLIPTLSMAQTAPLFDVRVALPGTLVVS